MPNVRSRPAVHDPLIPAWHVDFHDGQRYRIIRPDAAAELVGIQNDRRRFPMRQPDDWELEALTDGQQLTERGEWRITRTQIRASEFCD